MKHRVSIDRTLWILKVRWESLTPRQRQACWIAIPAACLVLVIGVLALWPSSPRPPGRDRTQAAAPVGAPLPPYSPAADPAADAARLATMSDEELRREYRIRTAAMQAADKSRAARLSQQLWVDLQRVNDALAAKAAEAVKPPPRPPASRPPPRRRP